MTGQTISHYEILEKLGEGGMGVVYKARDTKLDRFLALKFLPPRLNASEQDKARFIQEAKAAAALNHPNVCSIIDIQEHKGPDGDEQMFIVMELVEGQTLRERMRSSPDAAIPLKQAVDIGIQIADGLAAAHEKGIVHRDIKPENIMVRKDGIVQIMDFGLAKLRTSTSRINRLTKEGSTVGTAGYMSPEQVQGQDTDHRSDIFSYGVLLYELLTGQLPFRGVHDTALAYEIVNVDPAPMASVKEGLDPNLDAIVLECMEKDPRERTQSIAQVSLDLKKYRRESTKQRVSRVTAARQVFALPGNLPPEMQEPETKKSETNEPAAGRIWMIGTFLFLLTTVASIFYFRSGVTPPKAQVLRASILLPQKASLNVGRGGGHLALSPDGTKLAYVAVDSTGKSNLWVQSLDALAPQMLANTEGAQFPFWSPGGKSVAFFADGKLKRIDAAGGTPFQICDAADTRGGSWSKSDVIVFSNNSTIGLLSVSAAGGTPKEVTKLDSTRNEQTHRWPFFLPDGIHFLFFSRTTAAGSGSLADSICVGSIETGEIRRLLHGASDAMYAGGYLLFMRESALMAQRFDPVKLELSGEPVPCIQQIQYDARFSKITATVSQNGIIAYQATGARWMRDLALYDSAGNKIRAFGQPEVFTNAILSHDGKRICMENVDLQSHNVDLWLYEIERGIMSRFTFDPATDINPVWSPDDSRIIFSSNRKVHYDLYVKSTSGSATEELLTDFGSTDKGVTDWSPDGKYVLIVTPVNARTKADISILPMEGDRKPVPFLNTEFNEEAPRFSPDMKWIAYVSDETGKNEVYVRPFVPPGSQQGAGQTGKWQISSNGGSQARWRGDGKGIYIIKDTGISLAEVRATGSTFEVVRVTDYMKFPTTQRGFFKDMTADGSQILGQIEVPPAKSVPITLVVNWDEELRKK